MKSIFFDCNDQLAPVWDSVVQAGDPAIDVNKNGKADADEYYTTLTAAIQAVAAEKYPSPPSRFENLATKGKPTGLTLAFIEWILTDGQQYLNQAGYVPLTPDQQTESLAKLK